MVFNGADICTMICTWTPKVCSTMAFWALVRGAGPSCYIRLESRYSLYLFGALYRHIWVLEPCGLIDLRKPSFKGLCQCPLEGTPDPHISYSPYAVLIYPLFDCFVPVKLYKASRVPYYPSQGPQTLACTRVHTTVLVSRALRWITVRCLEGFK